MSPDSVANIKHDTPLLSVDDLRIVAVAVMLVRRCRFVLALSLINC